MPAPEHTISTKHCGVNLVDSISLDNHPLCKHGPTLLFERFFKDKPPQKYYACSACRDRKQCSFYQLYDEKPTKAKKFIQQETHKKLVKKKILKKLCEGDFWCYSCGIGLPHSSQHQHKEHLKTILKAKDLMAPTTFMYPKDNKKSNAQYFFNEETCSVFLKTIKRMGYKNILCVGTPRLHEVLLNNDLQVRSLLLDIDQRFSHFFNTKSFLHYNMFNGFFFNVDIGNELLKNFLCQSSTENTLIVVDPPFGALISLLAKMLQRLWNVCDNELPTMMVFPYFFESQILEQIPSFVMLDYKVCYTNHSQFNNSTTRGSPIRIFTNIAVDKVALPKENYRFCKVCDRYVYKENKHCKRCNKCTSKDGRSYIHCIICKICVKPDRIHCTICDRCEPKNHDCVKQAHLRCHRCGEKGHKRTDCPSSEKVTLIVNKRKSLFKDGHPKKLRKTKM